MRHPFEHLPNRLLPPLFLPLLALSLGMMVVFAIVGGRLNTPAAPYGIVSFELAGSAERAGAILASWGEIGRLHAAFIQGFDFLFLFVYSTSTALACIWSGRVLGRHWPGLKKLGGSLAWGQWLAALFDAIENIALVALLLGPLAAPWPQVAWVSAVIKFGLLIAGLAFALAGAGVRLTEARSPAGGATL